MDRAHTFLHFVITVLCLQIEIGSVNNLVFVQSDKLPNVQIDNPIIKFHSPIPLEKLKPIRRESNLFVLYLSGIGELESFFYIEAFNEFPFYTYFVIFIEDRHLDVDQAMKINMLKNSHFLVLFTTTAFGSKLKAYRSTLITDQPPDLFAFFDDEALQKPPMLFI